MSQDQVKEALLAIYDEQGFLDPPAVVEAAQDPDSPLHSHFTWDDTEAARKHRLTEARQVIRSVKLTIIDRTDAPAKINFFVSAPEVARADLADQEEIDQETLLRQSYVPAATLAGNDMATKIALRQMETDYKRLERRWGHYKDFWAMLAAKAQENAS